MTSNRKAQVANTFQTILGNRRLTAKIHA